jgi:hypothetical protein
MNRVLALFALAVVLLAPVITAAQTYNRGYGRGYGHGSGQAYNLSAEDQSRFDSYYGRWLEYRRTNNREEAASMERRMQEVMARYRIASSTPYSRIASSSGGHGNRNWGRPALPRFTPEDENRFRSYYDRWQQYRASNNRGELVSMERRMQEVMSHYSLPAGVTYDDVVQSFGGASGGSAWARRTYGYSFPQFSADDASRFRSYYGRWQEYRRTRNSAETASMESRMRDVMAHYNLPSNTSFDEVMTGLNAYNGSGR